MREELQLKPEYIVCNQEDYDALQEAITKLSNASEDQFQSMKKEKWYTRVYDKITFSQKNEKRVAEQISTLAQAQQILIEMLLRLAENDVNISEMVLTNSNDIRKISEQTVYLLSRINQLENVALGIRSDTDIRALSERAQKTLSALLYKLSENNPSNEKQADFANVVLSYLGDEDTQMENPFEALAAFDADTVSKKKMLACCMEYIFLSTCSDSAYDSYDDFIAEFDIGNKSIKDIKKQISSIYSLRGAKGLYGKYDPQNFKDDSDDFYVDFDDEEPDNNPEDTLEDVFIYSGDDIKENEHRVYSYKNVHIAGQIICEGLLSFDHCVVNYNEFGAGAGVEFHHTLSETTELNICDSTVICKGANISLGRDTEHLFSGTMDKVLIKSTKFEDCSYFMDCHVYDKLELSKCELINCFYNFMLINILEKTVCEITDNKILQNDLSLFNKMIQEDRGKIIHISEGVSEKRTVLVKNNYIEETPEFREIYQGNDPDEKELCYISGDSTMSVENCTFKGVSTPLEVNLIRKCEFRDCSGGIKYIFNAGDKQLSVQNCNFVNCTSVINCTNNAIISNCQFVSCYGDLIFSDMGWDGGVNIQDCQFINIKYIQDNDYIEHASITLERGKETYKTRENVIQNCLFDGVELSKAFLIMRKTQSDKPFGTAISVKNCKFSHCITKDKNYSVIKTNSSYYPRFSRKEEEFQAVDIENCSGLENVNSEGSLADNFKIREIAEDGEKIGFNG